MVESLERHRDLILYTDEFLSDPLTAKTAHGLLRFCPDRISAILDHRHAGQKLGTVCPWVGELGVPIVGSLGELPRHGSIVVGLVPAGSRFTHRQRDLLLAAVDAGCTVINGLHELLPPAPSVLNLRAPDPTDRRIARGEPGSATRVLTVGTSGGIGKMTTTILLHDVLAAGGLDVDWIATGQTGLLIRGRGSVIDAGVIDFVPGTIERLLDEATSPIVVIEGQGSIYHPAYSPSALALMHASRPQLWVLCHRAGQRLHRHTKFHLPSIDEAVRGHRAVFEVLGVDSELLGVSLDSSALTDDEYERERDSITRRLHVPCCDPIRESAHPLADPLIKRGTSRARGRRGDTRADGE